VFSSSGTDNVYARQQIAAWANSKFALDWDADRFAEVDIDAITKELIKATKEFLDGGRLDREIDQALTKHQAGANGELVEWAQKRFGRALNVEALKSDDHDPREVLRRAGRQLARWELTQLERYLLLRIYDQGWKDHLLEMDHLKSAIMQRPLGGDQTHPQSQYAIEGRQQFQQMWKIIRERVTDMLFKISSGTGDGGQAGGPPPSQLQMRHDSSTGAGFAGGDQAAAMRAQGEGAKPQTIRRDQPKVGRNDPCPCGSGKKYKQCCGKT
jgi:preprotein translocase subunit SecA